MEILFFGKSQSIFDFLDNNFSLFFAKSSEDFLDILQTRDFQAIIVEECVINEKILWKTRETSEKYPYIIMISQLENVNFWIKTKILDDIITYPVSNINLKLRINLSQNKYSISSNEKFDFLGLNSMDFYKMNLTSIGKILRQTELYKTNKIINFHLLKIQWLTFFLSIFNSKNLDNNVFNDAIDLSRNIINTYGFDMDIEKTALFASEFSLLSLENAYLPIILLMLIIRAVDLNGVKILLDKETKNNLEYFRIDINNQKILEAPNDFAINIKKIIQNNKESVFLSPCTKNDFTISLFCLVKKI